MTIVLTATAFAVVLSGLTMAGLEWAYAAPLAGHHIAPKKRMKADEAAKRRLFALNSVISMGILFGVPALGFDLFFREGPAPWWRIGLEAVAILFVYDLLYYAMHRALHHRKLMRYVHRVHHEVRTPTARESMYVHPAEMVAGLVLLWVSIALVGGVHPWSYALAIVPFQLINVVIHAGLDFPGPLALLNPWSHGHHGHHGVDMNRNFGQFTHLWDRLLGTAIR